MRPSITLAMLWMLLTATASPAPPGPAMGAVSGQVLGANRKPVAHARVTLQAADGELPRLVETNNQGRFSFAALRGGYYDLRAVAGGGVSDWRQNVLVTPGQDTSITLRLRPPQVPPSRSTATSSGGSGSVASH